MPPRLQTFDTKQLVVTFGTFTITGFAQDIIRVLYDSPRVIDEAGADGETVRVIQNDLRAAITISLQQTSAANDFLQGIGNADILTGAGVLPLTIRDTIGGGRDVLTAPQTWIATWPEVIRRKGVETHNWILRTNNMAMLLRGTDQSV